MLKIRELLFRRFSLLAGLLALASIFILSYFYYRLQVNSPFIYEQIIASISEYRVLDSRFSLFGNSGQVNLAVAKDNLSIQQSLISYAEEQFYSLGNLEIKVPNSDGLYEIQNSITSRMRWLAACSKGGSCNIEEWNSAQAKAWEACETLLASFYSLRWEQEDAWSKNLRIFYMLSVMLLLATLLFAAKRH